MHVKGKKVLILATHGFEQSELEIPRERLMEHGATVHVGSRPRSGKFAVGTIKIGAAPSRSIIRSTR